MVTRAMERGPVSPFVGSTVEPMTTSFFSFLRIDVLSSGDIARSWGTPTCNDGLPATALDGTAPLPPHADVARSAPASNAARLWKKGILNLAGSAVITGRPSNRLFARPARASDRRHLSRKSFYKENYSHHCTDGHDDPACERLREPSKKSSAEIAARQCDDGHRKREAPIYDAGDDERNQRNAVDRKGKHILDRVLRVEARQSGVR